MAAEGMIAGVLKLGNIVLHRRVSNEKSCVESNQKKGEIVQ